MGMDVRQRFWFCWINCYQMWAGRWRRLCRRRRDTLGFWSDRVLSVKLWRRGWAKLPLACFDKLVQHSRVERMHVEHFGEEEERVCFSVFVYSVEAACLSFQLLFAPRLKQTNKKNVVNRGGVSQWVFAHFHVINPLITQKNAPN